MRTFVWRLFSLACMALLLPVAAAAQEPARITGRVLSDAGAPLAAANVFIEGTSVGTLTNNEGQYVLTVPAGRFQAGQTVQLTAQLIGYGAQTRAITLNPGASVVQDFRLALDPLRLQEVVAVGSGLQARRERVGSSLATVDAVTIQRANEVNVVQALAGKVPGVITNQGGGDAGASTSIQIRGPKSITGTSQPLIVVDGVPINNNTRVAGTSVLQGPPTPNRAADINPEDIESIEILKGAAAASVYGVSAGSAGAILITTKRGRPGRTQYTLRSTFQMDEPIRTVPMQRKYGVGANGVSTACTATDCFLASNFFSWGPELPAGTPTYDHAAEIFETGRIFDNTLSMSGGSERTTFRLSVGALNHNGFIVSDADTYDRYSIHVNASHSFLDNLTVGASATYVQTGGSGVDRGNSINGLMLSALRQPPEFNAKQYLDPVTGLHRSWRFPNPGPTSFTNNRGFDNPFYAIYEDELTARSGRFYGNVNVTWTPLAWLQVRYTLGGDYVSDDRTLAFARSSSGLPGGQMERWQYWDRVLDHNLVVSGNWRLTNNIGAGLTVGQNLNETYFRQVNVVGQTWIAPKPFKLSNTVTRTTPNDSETRRRLAGYLFQGTLDLYDQLFLEGRVRYDGNSAFGVGNQWAWFPGAQVAWSFTKTVSLPENVVSFGKLRLAYGESGKEPPLYATQDVFTNAAFADFNPASLQRPTLNNIGGLYASGTRGTPDIKPERVKEFEVGMDLTLFGGRSDLSVTYYDSKAQDLIFPVTVAPSTGYSQVNLNAGELTNKGWEVAANFRPVQRPGFSFELGATWAKNENLVTSLGAIGPQLDGTIPMPTPKNCGPEAKLPRCVTGFANSFAGQATWAQVGYPLGVWRGQDFARCGRGLTTLTSGGVVHNIGAACEGQPDGALYIGPNGFPIMDPTERAIGNPYPDWTAGFTALISIKGIELSALVEHRQGGDVLNMTRASMYQYGTHKDTEIRGEKRIFGKNMLCHNKTCDVLNGPVVGPGAGMEVVIGESWFTGLGATGGPITQRLEDGTHTRLREVSIGYSFRQSWVQKLAGMSQIDVKVSGRNLGLWTDYSGFDPEPNLGGAANANRGIDWFNTPLARAWVVSVALHHRGPGRNRDDESV